MSNIYWYAENELIVECSVFNEDATICVSILTNAILFHRYSSVNAYKNWKDNASFTPHSRHGNQNKLSFIEC